VRWLPAAAVAALLVLAAGCGGGGGERLSRDAYVAKADAICRDAGTKRKALHAPSSIPQISPYVDRALPILDRARKELRALRPPAVLDDEVASWLDAVGQERDLLSDLRAAAEHRDIAKVRATGARGARVSARARALARSIGLVDCANS
jgi:hypothetical protein